MESLSVALGSRSYPIHIGTDLLARADLYRAYLGGGRAAIVTNEVVGPLYAGKVAAALEKAGTSVTQIEVKDGEAAKSWQSLNRIFDALLKATNRLSTARPLSPRR